MKKILFLSAILMAFIGGAAFAADNMVFPAKNGAVNFNHKQHQDHLKECKVCHVKGVGKIEGWGKDLAHKDCKGCHVDKGAGPTKCNECHKK